MDGDGSIMLNIQELQTILYYKLPIKIFLFNNDGYFSIRNTHKNYFKKIFASDKTSGVSFPNFEKLITAWGLKYEKIANKSQLKKLQRVMEYNGPILCELMIDPYQPMFKAWTAGQLREQKS
jgi:acetolactate synthase-1/2/3 large subunit